MLPWWKHGKEETKQFTEETEEVGTTTGPRAAVAIKKDTVREFYSPVEVGGIAHK